MEQPTIKPLSSHCLRCLGALAALTDAHESRRKFFKRWEIGCIVFGTCTGVQSKSMISLWSRGFAMPESKEAVALYQYRTCTCGCDRWAITDKGRAALAEFKVKVPVLRKPGPVKTEQDFRKLLDELFGGSPDDPADWWKKGGESPA